MTGRDPRARARARREPAVRRGPPEAGPRLLRGGAARGRGRRVARGAGGAIPTNRAAKMYLALLDPAAAADKSVARRPTGPAARTCSASRRRPSGSSSRRSPPTRRRAKATHTFLWIEKRGLTTFDAIAPRRGGVRRRGARHRLRGDEGQAGDDPPVAERPGPRSRAGARAGRATALRVLEAARHPHKLRLGPPARQPLRGRADRHGHGRGESPRCAPGSRRSARDGVPNRYGEQRFGADAAQRRARPGPAARRAPGARQAQAAS